MGNTITRLTHHHKSRHVHHDIAVTVPTPPPNHIDASPTSPPSPPRKPSLDPVSEAIIAATEQGMICENLLCSSLPSPVIRQEVVPRSQNQSESGHHEQQSTKSSSSVREEEYGYFPAAPQSVGLGSGSARSSGSHVQPRHESEGSKRGSIGGGRSIRWKGYDV